MYVHTTGYLYIEIFPHEHYPRINRSLLLLLLLLLQFLFFLRFFFSMLSFHFYFIFAPSVVLLCFLATPKTLTRISAYTFVSLPCSRSRVCALCVYMCFSFSIFFHFFFFLVLLFAVAAAAAAALSLHTIYIAALAIMHCAHTIRKGKEDNDVDDDGECLWCKRPYRYGIHTIRGSICFFFLASFYSPSTIHPSFAPHTHHITSCHPHPQKHYAGPDAPKKRIIWLTEEMRMCLCGLHSLTLSLSLLYVFASCIATPQCTYVYDVRRTYP